MTQFICTLNVVSVQIYHVFKNCFDQINDIIVLKVYNVLKGIINNFKLV